MYTPLKGTSIKVPLKSAKFSSGGLRKLNKKAIGWSNSEATTRQFSG
jgi:hypothetical protein